MPTTLYFAPATAFLKGGGTYPTLATNYANLTPTAAITTEGRMLPYAYNTAANLSTSSNASTAAQSRRYGRFFSTPFEIDFNYQHPTTAGQEILFRGADYQSNANANHCVQQACIYVWRPSTGAVVGYLQQAAVLATGTKEPTATSTAQNTLGSYLTTAGSIAILAGDILVVEPWATFTQGSATAYTIRFYYGGGTTISVENTTNTTPASCIIFQHVTLPLALPSSAAAGIIDLRGTMQLVAPKFQSQLHVSTAMSAMLTDGSYLQAALAADPVLTADLNTSVRFKASLTARSRINAHLQDQHSLSAQLHAGAGMAVDASGGHALDNLALYYTGSGSPATPKQSIGGPLAEYPVKGGQVTTTVFVPGISVQAAIGLPAGTYDIVVNPTAGTLTLSLWRGVVSAIATFKASGDVVLLGLRDKGFAVVSIDNIAALQAGTLRFTVADYKNGLFTNLADSYLVTGCTVYRALFLFNRSTVEARDVSVSVGSISGETVDVGLEVEPDIRMNGIWPVSRVSAGLDPTGWGALTLVDGVVQADMLLELEGLPVIASTAPAEQSSTGTSSYPTPIADEFDYGGILQHVNFKQSISWSRIAPGRGVSFWVRKVTPTGIVKPYSGNVDLIIEATS